MSTAHATISHGLVAMIGCKGVGLDGEAFTLWQVIAVATVL